jgi:hypothetical protein
MADLPYGTRLTYMGLWSLADDDGYLRWELRDIAAELYRFESPKKRETRVEQQLAELVTAGRVQVLACDRHALIASIPKYRVKGGNQTDQHHRVHTGECSVRTSTDKSLSYTSSSSVTDTSSSSFSGSVRAPARERSGSKNLPDEDFLATSREIVAHPEDYPAFAVKEAQKTVSAAERQN